MTIHKKIQKLLDEHKNELPSYAWPGMYPLFYITADCAALCPVCANMAVENGLANDPADTQWYIIEYETNWEDEHFYCEHCSKRIESAYGDDEE